MNESLRKGLEFLLPILTTGAIGGIFVFSLEKLSEKHYNNELIRRCVEWYNKIKKEESNVVRGNPYI